MNIQQFYRAILLLIELTMLLFILFTISKAIQARILDILMIDLDIDINININIDNIIGTIYNPRQLKIVENLL